ncbi:hypothetical protein WA577_002760 [Blastocystis sp. JDR]
MFKEVVVSTSLKENTINIWDLNSCSNIFEFKENCGIHNGTALIRIANLDDDYGLYPQSIYSIQSTKPLINAWKYGKPSPIFRNSMGERMTCLCASSDGAFLFGGSFSGKLYVWCVSSGDLLNIVDAHYKGVTVIRCLPDMSSIITGGDDGLIRQWSMAELIGGLDDVNSIIRPLWTASDHALGITDLVLNSGMYLVSSSLDKTIRVWNLFSHQLISTITTPSIPRCLCLTHTESRCYAGFADGSISILDFGQPLEANVIGGSGGENEQRLKSGHEDSVTCLAITSDDRFVISGGKDGRVFVWDASSLQMIKEYKGGNASAKGGDAGSKDKDNQDESIVFLEVMPYPTLLFENENLLYPLKALKKFKTTAMNSFEPTLSMSPVTEESGNGGGVRYVGGESMQSGAPVVLPTVEEAPKAEEKTDLEAENAKLKELSEKWKNVAERMYQQLVTMQETK